MFGHEILGDLDNDLIHNFARPGESAIGERIIVHGRVLDERGTGVAGALLEFWQANAGGRYRHKQGDLSGAARPEFRRLRPRHHRRRRCVSFPHGQTRRLSMAEWAERLATGAYPFLGVWPRLRAATDHPDVFRGRSDDLEMPDRRARSPTRAAIEQLVAALDMEATIPMDARAYKFDIVLRGRRSTLFENRPEGN